jgi:hypothetical protein
MRCFFNVTELIILESVRQYSFVIFFFFVIFHRRRVLLGTLFENFKIPSFDAGILFSIMTNFHLWGHEHCFMFCSSHLIFIMILFNY